MMRLHVALLHTAEARVVGYLCGCVDGLQSAGIQSWVWKYIQVDY